MKMLDLMEYVARSGNYVVNPLYVMCPICRKWVSMGRVSTAGGEGKRGGGGGH